MGSSGTRDRTRVPCTGRQILICCATREVLTFYFESKRNHDFCLEQSLGNRKERSYILIEGYRKKIWNSEIWHSVWLVKSWEKKFYFLFLPYFFFSFFLIDWLIDWWLCWVFVSVQGLSPVAASRGHSSSRCAGLSRCGAQAPDAQAQQLWLAGLVTPRHVGSSQTRARTRVPCTGRQTPNHCTTREALSSSF